ncbi:MAG: PilZ domain-containing protein [Candidatus Omnitrophica bacterium]|nr:PilZ domain-containing protein [Candidatus Omnitrophota bacterium]
MPKGRERRVHPRIDHKLPIKVAIDKYGFVTSTKNVSCVGAYCHITKYIPPFTKVSVKLSLPVATDHGKKNYTVECKGVLVRTEDEARGGFNIAIFFNNIKEDEKKKISQYLSQYLTHQVIA